MKSECLTLWDTAKLFPQHLHKGYSSIVGSPTSSSTLVMFHFFFIIAILMGVKWCLIVVLIFISLVTNDVEHLFMYLGHLHVLLGEMSTQIFCPVLNWIVLLLLSCRNCSYILHILFSTYLCLVLLYIPIHFCIFLYFFFLVVVLCQF